MLADIAVWMKIGPVSMVRALERFDRRQVDVKTQSTRDRDANRLLRVRIFSGVAVLALTVLYLSFGGAAASMRQSLFLATLVKVFVISWTFWLLMLLRRLVLAE